MRHVRLDLLATALLFACSATEDPGQRLPGDRTAGSGGAQVQTGGTGSGGAAGTAGGDGFGNTDAGPPILPMIDASTSGGSGGSAPDEDECGATEVEPMIKMEVIPGNVLLVFDRSGSMEDDWDVTGVEKYAEARDAITAALSPLQDDISAGTVFFPVAEGCPDECCVPAIGDSPQIPFVAGPGFLTAWDDFWATADEPDGRTPLLEGLQAADQALQSTELEGVTNVVVITDGEPNCAVDDMDTDEQIDLLTALPAQWLSEGILTHVVGLPGIDEAEALMVLDAVAAAGGTTSHLVPTDPAALQAELAKIIGESVTTNFDSCRIGLPHEPPNLDDVNLLVVHEGQEQSVDRDLGDSGGWTLSSDALEIVLQGHFCELAQQGEYDKISVVFGCVQLPPLPPPPVPE